MSDNVTIVATVVDRNGVRICCLHGDYWFVRKSLQLSYDDTCKRGLTTVLRDATVRFGAAQLVIDDKVVGNDSRREVAYVVDLVNYISDDYTYDMFCAGYARYKSYYDRLCRHIAKEGYIDVSTR